MLTYIFIAYIVYKFGKGVYVSATAAPVAGATTVSFATRASTFAKSVF